MTKIHWEVSPQKNKDPSLTTSSNPLSNLYFEKCNLFLRHGFTTIAISSNNSIGRLCALRKGDCVYRLVFFYLKKMLKN